MGDIAVNVNLRDEEARHLWQHGFSEGWLARDKEVRQQTVSHPRTWRERLIGKRRSDA